MLMLDDRKAIRPVKSTSMAVPEVYFWVLVA